MAKQTNHPSFELFRTYLLRPAKNAHSSAASVGGFWFTPGRKVNVSKEVAYQQHRFIELSKDYLETQPWISMLACIKHHEVERQYEISSARFSDLKDKEFWDDLVTEVAQLESDCKSTLDIDTLEELPALCDYQVQAENIDRATETIAGLKIMRQQLSTIEAAFQNSPIPSVGPLLLTAVIGAGAFFCGLAVNWIADSISELRGHEVQVGTALIAVAVIFAIVTVALARSFLTRYRAWEEQQRLQAEHRSLQEQINAEYCSVVTPCLRLTREDEDACWRDFEYASRVISYVVKYDVYLRDKFLAQFK